MSSYFDEHDCEPLGDNEAPNHLLHLARLLRDFGLSDEFQHEFLRHHPAPPASKKVTEELPTVKVTAAQADKELKCPVCLAAFCTDEDGKQLPCNHIFHAQCLLPWLQKTNTCPLCRHELPTDNPDYEEARRFKARERQRQFEQQSLHDSMYT